MKRLAYFLLAIAIAALAWCVIALIGYFTKMPELILSLIAGGAIGIWSVRCAHWIIDKITDKHERT